MDYEATQPVNLPVTDFLELEFYLMDTRPGVKPEVFVAELVKRWLKRENERLALRKSGPALRGFQWKNLFLPDGTNLRTRYRDTVDHAKVCGDRMVSDDGLVLTPSQFANRHADGRNAWRFVWLRFPGKEQWVRAHPTGLPPATYAEDRTSASGRTLSYTECGANSTRRYSWMLMRNVDGTFSLASYCSARTVLLR